MESGNKSNIITRQILVFFLVSFMSMVAQIIYLRQLLLLFHNSEYIISVFWLLWLGSNTIGVYAGKKIKKTIKLYSVIMLYLSIIIVFYFGLLSLKPLLLKIQILKLVLPGILLAIILITIPSFLNGIIFTLFCQKIHKPKPVSFLYSVEALSFILAGITATFIIYITSDFILITVTTILICILVIYENRKVIEIIWSVFLIFLLTLNTTINHLSFNATIKNHKHLETKITPSGQVDLLVNEYNDTLTLLQGSTTNILKPPAAIEEALFPVLGQDLKISNVLLTGEELAPILEGFYSLDYKNLTIPVTDSKYFGIIRSTFPELSQKTLNRKNTYIKRKPLHKILDSNNNTFELILVNDQSPWLMKNSLLFFPKNVKRFKNSLQEDGILCILLPSESAYSGINNQILKGSIYRNIHEKFENTEILLLNNYTVLLASDKSINSSYESISSILNRKGIATQYFNEYNISTRLANANSIGAKKMKSCDFVQSYNTPVTYFSGIVHLIGNYSVNSASYILQAGTSIYQRQLVWQIITMALLAFIYYFLTHKKNCDTRVLHAGFAGISFQILLLYLYQMNFGLVYMKIGVLIALFMAGVWLGLYINQIKKLKCKKIVHPVFILAILLLLISYFLIDPREIIAFTAMIFSGAYTGNSFKYAEEQVKSKSKSINLYIQDLTGSILGNVFIPIIFLPVMGFYFTFSIVFITGIISWTIKSSRVNIE